MAVPARRTAGPAPPRGRPQPSSARVGVAARVDRLQRAAIGGCLVMVAALSVVQAAPALPDPPLLLFLVFVGVWLFGALMLWTSPLFGAIGTAAYGVLLGVQLFAMHGVTPVNVLLGAGSFAVAALAGLYFRELRRARTGGIAV